MSIQNEINARTGRLREILAESNEAIGGKGGTAAADLSGIPAAIGAIPGAEPVLQIKSVTPTGRVMSVTPDAGYDGLKSVRIAGDERLVPENIAEGVTIYGVTGVFEGGVSMPEPYAGYITEAEAVYTGEYANVVYSEGYAEHTDAYYRTVMFLLDNWAISTYDESTTGYTHSGFIMVQKKDDGEWVMTDYSADATGEHYAKNIKAASCYVTCGSTVLFPVGLSKRAGVGNPQYDAVNLLPYDYLSFENLSGSIGNACLNSVWTEESVINDGTIAHSGNCCYSVKTFQTMSGYYGISYIDVCKAAFGHYYYCQSWAKQTVPNEEKPGRLTISYGAAASTTNIHREIMPITAVGEWELVGGRIYVDPEKITALEPTYEVWLKFGCGVSLDQAEAVTYADDVLIVDLTETFGAGHEPVAEECRAIFADYDGVSRFVNSKSTVPQYYIGTASETDGNTTLTASVTCQPGDLIVAAITTRDTLTVSDGWTLLSTSGINSNDTTNGQRLSWAYKFALGNTETITVIQASPQRLYINLVAISNATGVSDNGYTYLNIKGGSITAPKPEGLTLWAVTCQSYPSSNPLWTASHDMPLIQLGEVSQSRLMVALDESNEESVTFTVPGSTGTTMIAGALTVHGIDAFC